MDNLVALDACQQYDVDQIEGLLRDQITRLGLDDKLHEGMTVALKLNLVTAMKPDTAGTTHPAVVEAMCRILISRGIKVVMGDSPGGPFNAPYLKTVYSICGLGEIAQRTGAILNEDFDQCNDQFMDGVIAKNITVTSWLVKADAIINMCKLKTHGMMGMSAAVKNMFGSIPGTMKPEYHFRFPEQADFANMLIDLQQYWKPKMIMHVVDGIVGMEGNGPTAGTPRQIGVLMTGEDPYALDLIGGRIIGLEQNQVLTMSEAYKRGLSKESADQVEVIIAGDKALGTKDTLAPFMIPDYKLLTESSDLGFGGNSPFQKLRGKILSKVFTSRPQVKADECVGCQKCFQICPAKTITMKDKIPVIDRSKCIKCFCCQEFCPKGAMKVQRTGLARLLTKI